MNGVLPVYTLYLEDAIVRKTDELSVVAELALHKHFEIQTSLQLSPTCPSVNWPGGVESSILT